MCNINILINLKNRKIKNLVGFLMAVTSASYSHNSDGDGIYYNNRLIKKESKINIFNLSKEIYQSKIIITHQRKATSGFHSRWTQPFINKDFVLVHNGILSGFNEREGSDTWGFFKKFNKNFLLDNSGNREERIIASIKKLLDYNDRSTYSIAIYDRITEKLYYFKDNLTDIYFFMGEGFLFITTEFLNRKFLNFIEEDLKKIEMKNINPYKIYRIDFHENINIEIVSLIENINYSNFLEKYNRFYNRIRENFSLEY